MNKIYLPKFFIQDFLLSDIFSFAEINNYKSNNPVHLTL
jgi:hypothetical protein